MRPLSVGYYADVNHGTKVHIHRTGHGPLCGAKVKGSYQWCSWDNREYVECGNCLRTKIGRLLQAKERVMSELNIILGGR